MKFINKILIFLIALTGCINIFLYLFLKTIKNTIGTLEINHLIWALQLNNEGVDVSVVILYVSRLALALFLCFLFCFIVYGHNKIYNFLFCKNPKLSIYNLSLSRLSKFKPLFSFVILVLLSNFGYHTFLRVNESSDLVYYFQNNFIKNYPEHDFFEENYYVPKLNEISFTKKKNIIIILVESFENTYFDPKNPYHVNSKINFDSSISFINFKQCSNAGFTLGALTAWHFGIPLNLPLKSPNHYIADKFLPNALSVFEVLKSNGYDNYLLLGSDKYYSSQNKLFEQHGNFSIKDKFYWIEKGYPLDKYKGSGWGFNDIFVLERGIEQYKSLLKKHNPFAMIIETIDLHFPKGWSPAEYSKYNDLRDPIVYCDNQIANFIAQFKQINDPSTILMVLGDHRFMGVSKIINSDVERSIFNAIYNSQKKVSKTKQREIVTALDVAPTILDLCGGKWKRKQFGLGISLISEERSLIEKYGEKKV